MQDLLSPVDKSRYYEFEIHIRVEVTPSPEGKAFSFTGDWALPPAGNYPDRVLDAIEMYLRIINVAAKFEKTIKETIVAL